MKEKNNSKHNKEIAYEITELIPKWLKNEFLTDEKFIELKDIIKFYLINTPCPNISSCGIDMTKWSNGSLVLLNKLKEKSDLKNKINFEYTTKKEELKNLINNYKLAENFINIKNNKIIFFKKNKDKIVESIFRHIRNSIAHSRWIMKNNMFYFEDVEEKEFNKIIKWYVTARIILSKDDLYNWIEIIKNGPSKDDLDRINIDKNASNILNEILKEYDEYSKKEICKKFNITNALWCRLCKIGKQKKIVKFLKEKRKWKKIIKNMMEAKK